MKKFLKISVLIIGGLFAVVILIYIANILIYRYGSIKTSKENNLITYADKQFSYSFKYPDTWTRTTQPLLEKGYAKISPVKDTNTSMQFWYKDSQKITNTDELLTFAKDDATYAEKEQSITTISLTKNKLGNYDAILWASKDSSGKVLNTYYITSPSTTPDQLIFVWVVIVDHGNQGYDSDINSILNTYKILD